MQRLQLTGLCTGFSGSAALDSFSHRRNSSSSFAVFPGEVFAAGIALVGIVPDPVDQNDFSFRFFAHFDILLGCDPSPGKSGNDKSPVVKVSHHRAM